MSMAVCRRMPTCNAPPCSQFRTGGTADLCRLLADRSGMRVLSVDYRLAPGRWLLLPVPRCHSYTPARELTTVCTRVQNTPSLLPMMMHLLPTSGCLTTLQHWVSTPAGSLSLCACLLASGFPCDALATRCRIFVGGDSVGGHLAAGVCLDCRDRGIRQPVGQILVYPATDHTMGAPSVTA